MVFDLTEPTIDEESFEKQDWLNSFYVANNIVLKETLPTNMSKSRGMRCTMIIYVDVDYLSNSTTC